MKKLTIAGLVLFTAASLSAAAIFGSESARREEEKRVTVSANVSSDNVCDDETPVAVVVHNGSSSVLKRMSVTVELFESGDSSAVGTLFVDWTTIVNAGATQTRCFRAHFVRQPVGHLTVVAERHSVDFYKSGETIPW